jgi:hypothetical protein
LWYPTGRWVTATLGELWRFLNDRDYGRVWRIDVHPVPSNFVGKIIMKKHYLAIIASLVFAVCYTPQGYASLFDDTYLQANRAPSAFDFLLPLSKRKDVNNFVNEMVSQYGFDEDQLRSWFSETHFTKHDAPLRSKTLVYLSKTFYT